VAPQTWPQKESGNYFIFIVNVTIELESLPVAVVCTVLGQTNPHYILIASVFSAQDLRKCCNTNKDKFNDHHGGP